MLTSTEFWPLRAKKYSPRPLCAPSFTDCNQDNTVQGYIDERKIALTYLTLPLVNPHYSLALPPAGVVLMVCVLVFILLYSALRLACIA